MADKKTIVNLFDEIIEGYALTEEHRAFLEKRKEQVIAKAKANSTAQAKKNAEKEKYKTAILEYMRSVGGKHRVGELITKPWNVDALSSPNVTNILGTMIADGTVQRVVEKGISYYSVV